METWQLFLDESGSFVGRKREAGQQSVTHARGKPPWLIGGVLLKAPDRADFVERLGRMVDRAFPGVDYPAHATELHQLSAHALLAHRRHLELSPKTDAVGAAVAGARVLDAAGRGDLETERGPCTPGHLQGPTTRWQWADLNAATKWLVREARRDPEVEQARAACQRLLERHRGRVKQLFRAAKEHWNARVVMVRCKNGKSSHQLSGGDYLELLEALVERVQASIVRPTPTRLVVHTAGLVIWIPPDRYPYLDQKHVQAVGEASSPLAEAIAAAADHVRPEGQATVPARYDAHVHPGLVLADFACHKLQSVQGSSLNSLTGVVSSHLGCSPTVVPRWSVTSVGLPLLCGTGEARDRVRISAALPTVSPTADPAPAAGWERAQADRWCEALRSGPFSPASSPDEDGSEA